MAKGYVGWSLPENERSKLLAQYPPRFPDVIGHHITLAFGVDDTCPLPTETSGLVVGYATDDVGLECLVVEIGGDTLRPDGKTYHVTWSMDKAAGYKPVMSNDVIADFGVAPVSDPTEIRIVPRFF